MSLPFRPLVRTVFDQSASAPSPADGRSVAPAILSDARACSTRCTPARRSVLYSSARAIRALSSGLENDSHQSAAMSTFV